MRAILLKKIGDYQNLSLKDIDSPKSMTKNDIVIRHTFVGVNFDDVLVRSGFIKCDKTPEIIGFEGVGVIEKVGSGISKFRVGQRVGYGFSPLGAYCEQRVLDANYCVSIPDDISDENAAAILRKGLTAHSMLFRCHVPRKNDVIFVTGAGSGVGQIIARWAKNSGVRVIGGVGSDAKKDSVMSAGCDLVVNIKNQKEAIDKIAEFTDNAGVDAVYDSIGKDAFETCLKSLRIFGSFISYGNTSGNIEPIDVSLFESKCIFFTKPRLEIYKSNRNELVISAHELFEAFKKGYILTNVSRYSFSAIPNAHKDIESRKITGSVVASL